MSKSIVLIVLVVFGILLSTASLPDERSLPKRGRVLEVYPIRQVFGTDEEVVICYRLTNVSHEVYEENMPHEFGGLIWDWFQVYHGGAKLPNRLSRKDYGFTKKTSLAPGESVTIAFHLSKICILPDVAGRTGYYEIRGKGIGDMADPHLPILVLSEPLLIIAKKPEPGAEEPDYREGVGNDCFCQSLLSSPYSSPYDKVKLLGQLRKDDPLRFRKFLLVCTEAYAQVLLLDECKGGEIDANTLLTLADSNDLSVRRASLRLLAKTKTGDKVKEELKKMLPAEDQIVSELLKQIISK